MKNKSDRIMAPITIPIIRKAMCPRVSPMIPPNSLLSAGNKILAVGVDKLNKRMNIMLNFVLFDYDGTLLDSTAITYESFKEAFAELGYGDLGLEFFRREFSMNHHEMYRKMGVRKGDVNKVEDIWWGYWDVMKGDIRYFLKLSLLLRSCIPWELV
jgi:hypothetical protein